MFCQILEKHAINDPKKVKITHDAILKVFRLKEPDEKIVIKGQILSPSPRSAKVI